MQRTYYRTSEVASAAGVHPNTVRLYEEWGFLQPPARSESGYRLFTQEHIDQMRLARAAMHGTWPGKRIRESALALVRQAAGGDLRAALKQAHEHLRLVQDEQARAELAASLVERWVDGAFSEPLPRPLAMSQAASLLDLTSDTIRVGSGKACCGCRAIRSMAIAGTAPRRSTGCASSGCFDWPGTAPWRSSA